MIKNADTIETLSALSTRYSIPRMARVRQIFPDDCIKDIPYEMLKEFSRPEVAIQLKKIQPGDSVAITCGSRGIANMALVIKQVVALVFLKGGKPFVFPAMGSHGGANAEGQAQLIAEYGVTEEDLGCPIRSSMEVTYIGDTMDGRPTYIDRNAAEANHIIVINRIKAHTAFRGPYESGLMKMMVIGMGKQVGAETCHDLGFGEMAKNLPIFGNSIINHAPILLGIGLVENAYDETCKIAVLTPQEIPKREPELLEYAKSRMGRILFPCIDVLIVDRIGKNISGDGMDPNITGRFPTPYGAGMLDAQRVAVLDLTEETHGNCFGVGMADVTTQRLLERSNLEIMYINALTSTLLPATKIPMLAKNHVEAIGACIKTCNKIDRNNPKIVRIQDTLHLGEILISEALLQEAEESPYIEIIEDCKPMMFNEEGNLF